jgi:uncharacterized protein
VKLESESGEVTVLHYTVDAQVGGKVAQLGSRLIDGTAKKLAAEFFTRFAAIVAPVAVAAEPEVEPKAGWLGRFTGVASVAVLLAAGGANWCCLSGAHHTASARSLDTAICSSQAPRQNFLAF